MNIILFTSKEFTLVFIFLYYKQMTFNLKLYSCWNLIPVQIDTGTNNTNNKQDMNNIQQFSSFSREPVDTMWWYFHLQLNDGNGFAVNYKTIHVLHRLF